MRKLFDAILMYVLSLLLACSASTVSNRMSSVNQARTYLARGDTTTAVRTLQSLISSDTSQPEAFAALAEIYRSRNTINDRLKSQKILEQGLRHNPDSALLLMELGKTYYEQTFYPDAQRCFYRVSELADTTCDAYYYLGLNYYRKWQRNLMFEDELRNSYRFFTRAVGCRPGDIDWLFYLAFTSYALKDKAKSKALCEKILKIDPEHVDAYFLKGVIAFDAADYQTALESFESALSLLSLEEKSRFENIAPLLQDEEQLELYPSLNRKKRDEQTRVFWIKNDPDPTTALNERYIEHIARVWLADRYFASKALNIRGWETDRGIALIKFGWPAKIERDLGKGLTGRWEHWTYVTTKNIFFFDFMDEFLNDNFSIPIKNGEKKRELNERPTWSAFDPTQPPVPLDFVTYTFRDEFNNAILWIAVGLRAGQSDFAMVDADVDVSFRGVLFDQDWNVHKRFSDHLGPANHDDAIISPCIYTKRIVLPFDYFHYSISFEQKDGKSSSVYSSEINTRIYLGDSLSMSDILLHCTDKSSKENAYIIRGKERYLPNASREYFKGEDLGIYFEIYNLELRNRVSDYEISYVIQISPLDSPTSWSSLVSDIKSVVGVTNEHAPYISQTIARSGYTHTACERLWVDIHSLDPGRHAITIRVIDRISGEVCEGVAAFYKANPD